MKLGHCFSSLQWIYLKDSWGWRGRTSLEVYFILLVLWLLCACLTSLSPPSPPHQSPLPWKHGPFICVSLAVTATYTLHIVGTCFSPLTLETSLKWQYRSTKSIHITVKWVGDRGHQSIVSVINSLSFSSKHTYCCPACGLKHCPLASCHVVRLYHRALEWPWRRKGYLYTYI